LVARDVQEYVALSAGLAADRVRLEELRRTLRARARASSLMDEQGFVRALERAYLDMWDAFRTRTDERRNALEAGDDALLQQARAARERGALEEALAACEALVRRQPGHLEAVTLLWDLAFDAGHPGMAIEPLRRLIALEGGRAAPHYMLGCVLQAQGKIQDAMDAFERAAALEPGMARAHNNIGCLFEVAGVMDEAVNRYRQAIAADPTLASASYNLGNALRRLGDVQAARDQIARAVAQEAGHADWQCNLGELQQECGQLDAAIGSYQAALATDPKFQAAHASLGMALLAAGRGEEALAACERAVQLEPGDAAAASRALWMRLHLRDDSERASAEAAQAWARRHGSEVLRSTSHPRRGRLPARALRVGYFLPDPRWSRVTPFVLGLLQAHDPAAVEASLYANHAGVDAESLALREACPRWRDLSGLNDHRAALRVRADGIDVLIDLAGHSPGGRPLALAQGPAAVQAAWLGYPASLELEAMEYRLTDAATDQPGAAGPERLLRLPGPLLCYAPPEASPEPGAPPGAAGRGVTFGCFVDLACVTPAMLGLWARILGAVPASRLVLGCAALEAEGVRHSVLQALAQQGVPAGRVTLLAGGAGAPARLERYRAVDVALDTFPWNGALETCEALWMGVPVVTLAGASRQAHTGASLLAAAGLAELVARNADGYVAAAAALAGDAARLGRLRAELRPRLRSSPLLDAARFARGMEAACREMLQSADPRRTAQLRGAA
jgi:predicted O-linked N-acetylglucosamine transferase (SPINDLY family)